MANLDFINRSNAEYVDSLYQQYLRDPASASAVVDALGDRPVTAIVNNAGGFVGRATDDLPAMADRWCCARGGTPLRSAGRTYDPLAQFVPDSCKPSRPAPNGRLKVSRKENQRAKQNPACRDTLRQRTR